MVAISLLLVCSGASQAKCGAVTYEVAVTVLERGSAEPLAGVSLLFFVPGKELALRLRAGDAQRALTDAAGVFRGQLRFNTYSGWWFGDRCQGRLRSLDVIAAPQDRPAERVRFRRLRSSQASQAHVLTLEPLTVEVYP